MKLGKAGGKSGDNPDAKESPAEAGPVGRLEAQPPK
jgi:hypothetical protein